MALLLFTVAMHSIVFVDVFVSVRTITQETAALSLIKFCTTMYLDNRTNPIEFQGHRSKVKVIGRDFLIFHHCEIGQKVCGHDDS